MPEPGEGTKSASLRSLKNRCCNEVFVIPAPEIFMHCANTVAAVYAKVPPFATYDVHTHSTVASPFARPIKSRSYSTNAPKKKSSKRRSPHRPIAIRSRVSRSPADLS